MLYTALWNGVCCTKALAHCCLPSRAHALLYLRCSGSVPGGLCAKRLLAIGVPKPLGTLPRVVRDPAPCGSGLLLLLAQLGDRTFLAHPRGQRSANGVYHYKAEHIRLVNLDRLQSVQTKDFGGVAPLSLDDVNGAPAGRHGSLKVASSLSMCMAEIYAARVAGRALDFSGFLDINPLDWPGAFWDRKLLLVWQDGGGTNHASVGPNIYTIVRDCSGAMSSAASS